MILKNCDLFGKICDIEIKNGKILRVGKIDKKGIDIKGNLVYPGLVDIHTHGAGTFDTMDKGGIFEISEILAKQGTTSFLPTTMTVDFNLIKETVNCDISEFKGSEILGFHLEGPYINEKFKGAQNKKFILKPEIKEFEKLKNIKLITLAPEVEGAMEFIKKCKAVVSLGHSDCDFETAKKAIKNGAKCLTHTFNAMNGIHHRAPGPIGAAFEEKIYVQVICDGLHIEKPVINMLYRLFGRKRMILISDSMRATGCPDGTYEFGGQEICVKNRVARTKDGNIAGSTSFLLDCVKKAVEFGIPRDDAFKMASETPADLLRIKKGRIKKGYDADLIILDKNLNLKQVIINGEKV